MSILHAIAACKKPIGEGVYRKVYYSPTYNVIIKRDISDDFYQNEREAQLVEKLTDEEKEIIPMIECIRLKKNNEPVILWKRVEALEKRISLDDTKYEDLWGWWQKDTYFDNLQLLVKGLKLIDNIQQILNIVEKYRLDDLKIVNLGIMNNHLVLLDCGWTRDDNY